MTANPVDLIGWLFPASLFRVEGGAGSKFAVQQPLLTHCDVLSFGSSTEGAAAPRLDSGQFRPPQGPVGRLMASRT